MISIIDFKSCGIKSVHLEGKSVSFRRKSTKLTFKFKFVNDFLIFYLVKYFFRIVFSPGLRAVCLTLKQKHKDNSSGKYVSLIQFLRNDLFKKLLVKGLT